MAEQLASVPEEITTGFTASSSSCNSYRRSIRKVDVVGPQWRFRSTRFSHSGSSYSSDSGTSSSYQSKNSGYSSGSASTCAVDVDFGADELTKIADRMVSNGYIQRMVDAFRLSLTLNNWFVDLDVDWVLKDHLQLQDTSTSQLQELVERWTRALNLIVISIKAELLATVHGKTTATAQFGEGSISAMLVFSEAIKDVIKVENLQILLQMYTCISNASYDMCTMHQIHTEAGKVFNNINSSLDRQGNRLIGSIFDTMMQVRRTLMKDNDSWGTEVLEGGGEVHKNTRLMVDYIILLSKAHASTQNYAQGHNTGKLGHLINYTIGYLNNLLLRKSELCLDPSLRYLFLLNNSYFIVQMVSATSVSLNPELLCGHQGGLKLTPECEKYMHRYLDVSWGNVVSFIPKSNVHAPLHRWIHTTPLAKFQSAFDNMYQAQKF